MYRPTHIKGNIIDIILSNTPFIHDICVEPSQPISSDHFIVSFGIEGIVKPVQKHKPELTFDFKNADMEGLLTYLLDYDFGYCFQINDIEQVWAVIKRAILNLYIPKVKMKSRKYPRWFNADIIHHLNCLRSLRRRIREHSIDQSMARLNSSEKFLHDNCLSAKASYESNLVCSSKSNTSLIFKHINSITGNNTIPPIVKLLLHLTMKKHIFLIVTFIQFLLTAHLLYLLSIYSCIQSE